MLDRNGKMLAGPGTASSVGLVPGKMSENRDADIERLAGLLDVTAESIEKETGSVLGNGRLDGAGQKYRKT